MREKLIELLETAADPLDVAVCGEVLVSTSKIADHLIANGVTIPVRCKDCKYYTEEEFRCDHPELNWEVECYDHWIDCNPDDFCSKGERRSE